MVQPPSNRSGSEYRCSIGRALSRGPPGLRLFVDMPRTVFRVKGFPVPVNFIGRHDNWSPVEPSPEHCGSGTGPSRIPVGARFRLAHPRRTCLDRRMSSRDRGARTGPSRPRKWLPNTQVKVPICKAGPCLGDEDHPLVPDRTEQTLTRSA